MLKKVKKVEHTRAHTHAHTISHCRLDILYLLTGVCKHS